MSTSPSAAPPPPREPHADVLALARGRVAHEADAVAAVADSLGTSFLDVVDLVASMSGKVLVAGVGTSGPIARRMAHLLSTSGTPAVFVHPADALHGGLGAVRPGDVLIAISKGGRSAEINDFVALARSRGAVAVALTGAPETPLSSLCEVTVVLPQTGGADPGGVIAMGSSLAVAAWGDALALVLMHRSGYSWDAVLQAHPAGAVGQLSAPGQEPS